DTGSEAGPPASRWARCSGSTHAASAPTGRPHAIATRISRTTSSSRDGSIARPMPSPVAELLGALGAVLDRLGVGWYLFGAQAALLYGAARLTADVDVTVDLGPRAASALVAALTAAGFELRVRADLDAFSARTRVVPLVHR